VHIFLTVRKLKPGSYDEWRKAWQPDLWPSGSTKAYILRNRNDPDEIVAFGMFEGDLDATLADPGMQAQQRTRTDRMAPYVASIATDGIYEVIEEVTP